MSSAAVQQSSSPSGYQQRDRYSADPSASLTSTSPVSRRSGRHGNGSDVGYGTPLSAATITPSRAQHGSSMSTGDMAASTYDQYYPDASGSRGQPTALPIRTSSGHSARSPTAAAFDNRPYSSRATYDAGYGSQDDRDRKRSTHRSPGATSPAQAPSSSRSQRSRGTPTQTRSQNQMPADGGLPRENSAIINHIVVDDPQSDIAREKARIAEAQPHTTGSDVTPVSGLGLVGEQGVPDSGRSSTTTRSRQEHLKSSSHRKEVKFGDYILGQTLGEGEFGKVKMGWKKDGGVQVAIKLIRKESLAGNATRLPKIYREISILRELQHPNIVRLHEFVETERHMGIILEYASGGELFDYILNHRYLKDPAARRLFAQLVSGVGYLHKKGIVHRDLKLENLLLDRHKNIIITDFGFANTFDPKDELSEEQEHRIADKEWIKREGLDVQNKDGFRRGDLMQTSCGSPCYAAPELVVSDGLYTGRKVDVWSCGVILYAMLAGYLPFDDDPANPEGDNINLLYKYIVSTPLTFPEYVTPHARDLLRRILVPDPRRRADLFEVARHSWLSEYSHVVGFIGSSTKSDRDIASSALTPDPEAQQLGRSSSVKEPSTRTPVPAPGAIQKQKPMNAEEERKAKRSTLQVEYVPPVGNTTRGETSPPITQPSAPIAGTGRTRARADSQGPVEVAPTQQPHQVHRKQVPSSSMAPPSRPGRDQSRVASDSSAFGGHSPQPINTAVSRPNTRGTLASRGNSYSQPAVASPTTENAQGQFSRPKSGSGYIISGPTAPTGSQVSGVSAASSRPGSSQNLSQMQPAQKLPRESGHKRSSTLGSITDRMLGRSSSRRRSEQAQEGMVQPEKRDRRHPPVSMRNAMPNSNEDAVPRPSSDSRRSSFQFLRKNSDNASVNRRNSRRFSFLPNSFSMNSFSGKKDQPYDSVDNSGRRESRPSSKGMAFGRGASRSPSRSTNSTNAMYYEPEREQQRTPRPPNASQDKALPPYPPQQTSQSRSNVSYPTPPPVQRKQYRDDGYGSNRLDSRTPQQQEPVERFYTPNQDLDSEAQYGGRDNRSPYPGQQNQHPYRDGYGREPLNQEYEQQSIPNSSTSNIRPNQRKFGDAYEKGHDGSSSGARRVMDFFRRRGKERGGA